MAAKYTMDMTRGSLFVQIARYMVPLALTYLLQLIFHATDLWVIGRYSDHNSLAGIGTTSTSIGLMINTLTGLSVGANAVVARYFGARDSVNMIRAVHTSIATALISGIFIVVVGLFASEPLMRAVDVPPEIMPLALTYLRISILGMPALLLYNFGCAILRAIGDTRRPLWFLIIAGLINVVLNLFLVIKCNMNVAGVAVATIVSQFISAFLVIMALRRNHGASRLHLSHIRIDWKSLRQILLVGVPAAVQSACFALSNFIIQGAINSFGGFAMAAMTVAGNIEYSMYAWCFSLHQTAISFIGQNSGAKKTDRMVKSCWICLLYSVVILTVLGWVYYFNGEVLVGFFISGNNPEIIHYAMMRMQILFITYGLLGVMDVASGVLRGMGRSVFPAVVTVLGACVFRIWWVKTVFAEHRTMPWLLWSYPVSWVLISAVLGGYIFIVFRKLFETKKYISFKPHR